MAFQVDRIDDIFVLKLFHLEALNSVQIVQASNSMEIVSDYLLKADAEIQQEIYFQKVFH